MLRTKKRLLIGLSIFLIFLLGCYYLHLAVRDVPLMDYWRCLTELAPNVMQGDLHFSDLWKDYIGQRNVLMRALVALNIKFAGFNCTIESYLGMLVLVLTFLFLSKWWLKNSKAIASQNVFWRYFSVLCIGIVFLNLNQWEIISLQFSFVFQLRILAYILILHGVDCTIKSKNIDHRVFFELGILCALTICLLSQLYFPALLLSILFIFLLDLFVWGSQGIRKMRAFFLFLIPCIVGIFIYLHGLSPIGGGTSSKLLFESISDGTFLQGCLVMLAGSLFPQTTLSSISVNSICVIGLVLLIVVIFAVFIYFKLGYYKNTYLPALIAAYGFISIPIIVYGRLSSFDLWYLTSSRYVCETRLIWVGCILVYCMALVQISQPAKLLFKRQVPLLIPVILLTVLSLYCDIKEMTVAPYRGVYKDELIALLNQDSIEFEDDDAIFSPFQAPADTVRTGIGYMKQYDLGIYSAQEKPGYTLADATNKQRIYEDGWVENNGSLKIQTHSSGKIKVVIYDPYISRHPDGMCTIYINGEAEKAFNLAENLEFELQGMANSVNTLRFDCSYSEKAEPPDEREELCFMLVQLESIE